jgi:uncharacterized PurR-regulated membrane protein YhhQ (DUF165 family)
MNRDAARWTALAIYVASIPVANWMIAHVGPTVLPGGRHLAPVGFGLSAPSGVYAAALAFPARDVVQRASGRRWALGAIVAGTLLSVLISPQLALASGCAFFFSELADYLVYTPLQQRNFVFAVFASGVAGSIVDSLIFLAIAGIPFGAALAGLVLGKFWVQLIVIPVSAWLRRRIPDAETGSTA